MTIKIIPRTAGSPVGKLADAELYFADGILAGLKLVGFTVWEQRDERGRGVTFPARQYLLNGERRHYILLRAAGESARRSEPLRDAILAAYAAHERQTAVRAAS